MTAPVVNPLPYNNKTPEWLLHRALLLKGNTFREILNADPYLTQEQKDEVISVANSQSAKGSLWHIIEENFFYYDKNSDKEADFPEAWVELKVSPYIKTNKWIRAKERLVLTLINYEEDYNVPFEKSHLHIKCKLMLLIYYFYEKNKAKLDYLINYVDLFQIPLEDIKIIKQDYYKIINKIAQWKAHELSEWDTLYLWACTKWVNAKSLRAQPKSRILAKQRAFCLKNSYMTMILNKYFVNWIHTYIWSMCDIRSELNVLKKDVITYWKAIKNADELKWDFEDFIIKKMEPYYWADADFLLKKFWINTTAKNNYAMLAKKMLWVNEDEIEEFAKANITIKTIRLKHNWVPKEAMSFPAFKYMEIYNQDYYDSDLYELFSESKFLFMVFEFTDKKNTHLVFKKAMFWNVPWADIEWKIKIAWEKTKNLIRWWEYDNLVKSSDDMIIHVRPHWRNAADTYPTPDWWCSTKKCFWFNQNYIKEQIEKGEN